MSPSPVDGGETWFPSTGNIRVCALLKPAPPQRRISRCEHRSRYGSVQSLLEFLFDGMFPRMQLHLPSRTACQNQQLESSRFRPVTEDRFQWYICLPDGTGLPHRLAEYNLDWDSHRISNLACRNTPGSIHDGKPGCNLSADSSGSIIAWQIHLPVLGAGSETVTPFRIKAIHC